MEQFSTENVDETVATPYMDICYQNIQGILSKLKDVMSNFNRCPCSVFIMNETFLNTEHHITLPPLTNILRQDRSDRQCRGGIAVCLAEDVLADHLYTNVPQSACEHLAFELSVERNKVFLIISVYRRPGQDMKRFLASMTRLIQFAAPYDNIIFVGDFNENLKGSQTKPIQCLMQSHGYIQHVTESTTLYNSILDHVYSKTLLDINVKVIPTYYSDHELIRIRIK